MKLLCVLNSGYIQRPDGLYLNKHTGNFIKELSETNTSIGVFQQKIIATGDFLADFNISNVRVNLFFAKKRKIKILTYLVITLKAIKLVRKYDCIYLFSPGISPLIFGIISFVFNKPFACYIRGEVGIDKQLYKWLFSKAKFNLTISDNFTSKIKKLNENTFSIRPMIDFNESDVKIREFKSNEAYSLLYVGRIEKDKGIYDLLSMAKLLVSNRIKFKMDIVGDGPDYEEFNSKIENDLMQDYLFLHGTISNKAELLNIYSKADLFVFLSHHEGFPRVLYEAMISGLPIITTFVGGIATFMQGVSIEVPVKNPEVAAKIVTYFLANYEQNALIAIDASKKIKHYLSEHKISHAQQVNELFISR